MPILIYGGMILVGFVSGYFLATPVLVVLTVVCMGYGAYITWTAQEMEGLIAAIYDICAGVAIVAMWVTHYNVTGQTWLGQFFSTYVLR